MVFWRASSRLQGSCRLKRGFRKAEAIQRGRLRFPDMSSEVETSLFGQRGAVDLLPTPIFPKRAENPPR